MDIGTSINTTPYLHQPERGEHESFAEYKLRRYGSHTAVKRILHPVIYGGPKDFVLHRASAAKSNRRERMKALGGVRQFKRWARKVGANAPAGY